VRGDGPPASYQSPNYAYQYAVKDDYSGVDFSADESRQADNTAGSYKVLLPDGRVQTVVYTVNGPEGGYIVDVAYEGEAKFAPVVPAPYKPAPAPVYKAAPAPYNPAPASYKPAPAPYKAAPAPAPAYQPAPAPSPYKAFPRFQQSTSYKSRIVFSDANAAKPAAAEEERNPKALADDSAINNEIPDVELVKESRIEPEESIIVDVAPQPQAVPVPEESRRRSTTTPISIIEEATTTFAPQEPAPALISLAPVARSTTLPPLVIDTTTFVSAFEAEAFSTSLPVFADEEIELDAPTTQAAPVPVVFELVTSPVQETTEAAAAAETTTAAATLAVETTTVAETAAPVEVSTTVPEVITPEAVKAIQAEAESTAEETNNVRRFARFRQYRPATRTRTTYADPSSSYPSFSQFSQRSLNVQPQAQPAAPVQVQYLQPSQPFNSPTIFYGNWVPVQY
jgi:hypothetical protein